MNLERFLTYARPEWSERELTCTLHRLQKAGIESAPRLMSLMCSGTLNEVMSSERPFSPETLESWETISSMRERIEEGELYRLQHEANDLEEQITRKIVKLANVTQSAKELREMRADNNVDPALATLSKEKSVFQVLTASRLGQENVLKKQERFRIAASSVKSRSASYRGPWMAASSIEEAWQSPANSSPQKEATKPSAKPWEAATSTATAPPNSWQAATPSALHWQSPTDASPKPVEAATPLAMHWQSSVNASPKLMEAATPLAMPWQSPTFVATKTLWRAASTTFQEPAAMPSAACWQSATTTASGAPWHTNKASELRWSRCVASEISEPPIGANFRIAGSDGPAGQESRAFVQEERRGEGSRKRAVRRQGSLPAASWLSPKNIRETMYGRAKCSHRSTVSAFFKDHQSPLRKARRAAVSSSVFGREAKLHRGMEPKRDDKAAPVHSNQQEIDASSEERRELEAAKARVFQRLLSAKRVPESERVPRIKQLVFQWHPDKHPEESRFFATQVFQYMQCMRDKMSI